MFKNKILFVLMMGVLSSYSPTLEEAQANLNAAIAEKEALSASYHRLCNANNERAEINIDISLKQLHIEQFRSTLKRMQESGRPDLIREYEDKLQNEVIELEELEDRLQSYNGVYEEYQQLKERKRAADQAIAKATDELAKIPEYITLANQRAFDKAEKDLIDAKAALIVAETELEQAKANVMNKKMEYQQATKAFNDLQQSIDI